MPDNTKASTEADTVEIKQEIPSNNASPNDKSSADSSPANKDGDLVNGGEEITTITETTKVTGSDGKVTISTNKKVKIKNYPVLKCGIEKNPLHLTYHCTRKDKGLI